MSIIHSSLLLGAGAAAGVYQIERSLRFNSSDSASLSRASYAGSGTFSCWVKRCKLGTAQTIISGIAFNASDQLNSSTAVFRDPSAWMHVLVSTSGTYVNGTSVASGSAITPGIIGSGCDLYLAYIHFIDGQALTPSSFTEVSATTGQLIPKSYTGSFGTNGFHLPFSDNSTAAALGTDTSGNGNSWTVNNIAPSNGATYSNRGSLSSSPPTLSGTISDIFDGLLNSSNAFSVNQANAGVTINFSPALPSGSSVKLVGGVYGTAGSNNSLQVNGTGYAQSLPASTGTYTEIVEVSVPAGASGITSIYIYREGISTFNFALYGIKVNDVLLVDGAAGDSLVDTPTSYGTDTGAGGEVRGNYATWNPLDNGGVTLANGNLDISNGSSHKAVRGTIKFPATGKWYAEFLLSTFTSGVNACAFGIDYSGATTPSAWGSSGHIYLGGNSTTLIGDINGAQTAISTTSIVGSIFQIAYDADAQKVWVGRDNTWYNSTWGTTGNPATGANPTASNISGGFPAVTTYETSGSANFGQRAFAYTAPSGFKALVDTNLTSTTITTSGTYTGNGVADGPFVYLNGVPTAMTIGGNAVTFGTHADKLANGFKIRTSSTTYNQNASSYNYSITSTDAAFKNARAQPNP